MTTSKIDICDDTMYNETNKDEYNDSEVGIVSYDDDSETFSIFFPRRMTDDQANLTVGETMELKWSKRAWSFGMETVGEVLALLGPHHAGILDVDTLLEINRRRALHLLHSHSVGLESVGVMAPNTPELKWYRYDSFKITPEWYKSQVKFADTILKAMINHDMESIIDLHLLIQNKS